MISCYYDIVLRVGEKRKGWKNIMKKQVKIIGGVAAAAVIATAGFFALGAGKKKAPEKKISLSEKAKTLTEGESFTLKVKNGDSKVSAKSKDKDVASVEKVAKTKADYKVTAVKAGETEIVFKKDSKTYSCKVTVNAKPAEAQPQQNAQAQAGTDAQQSSASQSGQPAQSSSQSASSSQSTPSSSSAKTSSSSAKSSSSGNSSSSSQRSSAQKSQSSSSSSYNRTPTSQSSQKSNKSQSSNRSSGSSNNSVTTDKTSERRASGENGNTFEDYKGFSGHDDWTSIEDNDE